MSNHPPCSAHVLFIVFNIVKKSFAYLTFTQCRYRLQKTTYFGGQRVREHLADRPLNCTRSHDCGAAMAHVPMLFGQL